MHVCDITLAYTDTSGGIRTYLDAKRDYLMSQTDHRHTLIIPGERDQQQSNDRSTTVQIASPTLPGCEPYRFFWRPGKIRSAIERACPDLIELGSFYVAPWPAFSYRKLVRQRGRRCAVSGFFHTDIAEAYVGDPLRHACADWPEAAEWLGSHFAEVAERAAETYVGAVFEMCDLKVASSPARAARLGEHGVEGVAVVPLGVDLERFSPRRRSDATRQALGADPSSLVLIYAGRLDSEKHVDVLADAVELLPADLQPRLVMIGEGPLRPNLEARATESSRLIVLPYEGDPDRFAEVLASADVYVTAGPHETFGLSVLEAQASGLPVVGVASGALVERVPDSLGRLGPVDDARAFASNIQEVARARRLLGENARRHVEQGFGWDATFQNLLTLYEEALGDESPETRAAGPDRDSG